MDNSQYHVKVGLASCGIAAGAAHVHQAFQKDLEQLPVNILGTGCLGMCYCEPLVEVTDKKGNQFLYGNVTTKDVPKIVQDHLQNDRPVDELLVFSPTKVGEDWDYLHRQTRFTLRNCGHIDPEDIDSYIGVGGYTGLRRALHELRPEDVISHVERAGLRGRGGGGFPTYLKWSFARQAQATPKYVVCNADEGDPGAFMDRSLLESDPHAVIEGMLLAGYAIGASHGFIYVRAEYPLAVKRLRLALEQAREKGLLGDTIIGSTFSFDIQVREGAGAFVCGEETALLMSIEGKRGMPRPRPPYPAERGLFGSPTVINNVETFANVPRIIYESPESFAQYGTDKSKGTKVFALAGKIKRGGLVEIPMGMTVNDIVFRIGGGISSGKAFKAIQTGGPSGGCIPAHLGDTPVDYESLALIGAIMGSGGLLVMDEETCMVNVAQYFLTFAKEESCGKCTFCRVGTEQMLRIVTKIAEGHGEMRDLELLEELSVKVQSGSLCGLGQTAPNPVLTTLKYFRDEYEAHIAQKVCPAKQCRALIQFSIDQDRCRSCNLCVRSCPVVAITSQDRLYQIDEEKCIRCGLCVSSCKFDAIVVRSEPKTAASVREVAK